MSADNRISPLLAQTKPRLLQGTVVGQPWYSSLLRSDQVRIYYSSRRTENPCDICSGMPPLSTDSRDNAAPDHLCSPVPSKASAGIDTPPAALTPTLLFQRAPSRRLPPVMDRPPCRAQQSRCRRQDLQQLSSKLVSAALLLKKNQEVCQLNYHCDKSRIVLWCGAGLPVG